MPQAYLELSRAIANKLSDSLSYSRYCKVTTRYAMIDAMRPSHPMHEAEPLGYPPPNMCRRRRRLPLHQLGGNVQLKFVVGQGSRSASRIFGGCWGSLAHAQALRPTTCGFDLSLAQHRGPRHPSYLSSFLLAN
jgi:hypothetical protein